MHRLASLSLANRSFIALVCIAVSIIGALAMTTMRQELIPQVALPQIQIITPAPGSSTEQVQSRVSQPIEQSVRGLENVEGTSSDSQANLSMITVELEYGTDTARSANQIDAAINQIEDQLPSNAEPQVMAGGTGDIPVAVLSVASDLEPAELGDRLNTSVIPELERVDGVSQVMLAGAPEQIVRITPDEDALEENGLTDTDIREAIDASGLTLPGGTVADGDTSLNVTIGTATANVEDLEAIALMPDSGGDEGADAAGGQGAEGVEGDAAGAEGQPMEGQDAEGAGAEAQGAEGADAEAQGAEAQGAEQQGAEQQQLAAPISLADVATVEQTTQDPDSISRTNGRESLVMVVFGAADSNVVDVSENVQAELDSLLPGVGGGATSEVVFDQAPFIQESIVALAEEGLLGLVFAVGVILLFLRSLRPTIVTAISIPTSLLMTFVGMMVAGYTINMLTLAAVTISIGRVVDDSIVVIENITRHMTYGKTRTRAILDGVKEVGGAITASTLATVVVFLPIAVVGGMAGELFRPFSLTVALAMIASLIVALTIVPVLAFWFLRLSKRTRAAVDAMDPQDPEQVAAVQRDAEEREERSWLHLIYAPVLRWTQAHRIITLVAAVAILVGTVAMYPLMKVNFLGDTGQNLASYEQTLSAGTTLEQSAEKADEAEQALLDLDGVETVQTTIGANQFGMGGASNEISYQVTTDSEAEQVALREQMLAALQDLPDAGEIEELDAAAGPAGSSSVDIQITGPTAEDRDAANDAIMAELDPLPAGVTEVTSDLEAEEPALVVSVDQEAAAERGLTEEAVVGLVASNLFPSSIGTLETADGDLAIYLEEGEAIDTRQQLEDLELAPGIPLEDVASVDEQPSRPSISTRNSVETVTISITPETEDVGAVSAEAQAAIDRADMPEGTAASLGGTAQDIDETFGQLGMAMLAAILLTYVLLVWIFKSLIQPLILLVSIPFAATGSFGLLILTQVPLGLPSMIGLLMLVGVVVTNAIVLIDLVNQYRRRGMGLDEALFQGASKRLRPILMTSAATIFALLPMAFGLTGNTG
ncbi:MAG: efflux RND transporter permease subunit, partial [Brachybacterium sp.]|nr:efflux RND transporter permease subunit [Brachybacterium sp.]